MEKWNKKKKKKEKIKLYQNVIFFVSKYISCGWDFSLCYDFFDIWMFFIQFATNLFPQWKLILKLSIWAVFIFGFVIFVFDFHKFCLFYHANCLDCFVALQASINVIFCVFIKNAITMVVLLEIPAALEKKKIKRKNSIHVCQKKKKHKHKITKQKKKRKIKIQKKVKYFGFNKYQWTRTDAFSPSFFLIITSSMCSIANSNAEIKLQSYSSWSLIQRYGI